MTDNWVHDNGAVGIWADTDNSGFNISGNYIAHNWAEGIIYEVSYNASITGNTFVDNAWGRGPPRHWVGSPPGALHLRVGQRQPGSGAYGASVHDRGQRLHGQLGWGGHLRELQPCLWDLQRRQVHPGRPRVPTRWSSCAANIPNGNTTGNPDYFDNCRWKTQNISVTNNMFNFTPADIGADCTTANMCGYNGLFCEYGSDRPLPGAGWSPTHISNTQNDHFSNNTYNGPWSFDGYSQGEQVTWAQWTAGFNDTSGSGAHFNGQDAGSTFGGLASTTPATTAPTTPTTAPPPTTTTTASTTTTTTASTTTTTTRPPTSPPAATGGSASTIVGRVTGVGVGSFSVTTLFGQPVTVQEQSSTNYSRQGTSVSPSQIVKGVWVVVQGVLSGSTDTAARIYLLPPGSFGS